MSITRAEIVNLYEHDVSVWDSDDDFLVIDGRERSRQDFVTLRDAEGDVVALVPRAKADALIRVLNWAADNAPYGDD